MKLTSEKRAFLINQSIFIGYAALTALGIYNHELWSDESHHWLIARDSSSLGELYVNLRYDGHPILWNILLYFVSRVTSDPIYVQLLHLGIVWSAMAIFLFRSPFPAITKWLFTLGYFPLYEYAVLSRNYSLILLFLFLALTYYPNWKQQPLRLGLALFFLANTHLLGLLLTIAFLAVLSYDFLSSKIKFSAQLTGSLMVVLVGIVLSVYQIIPPSNSVLVNTWMSYSITLEHFSRSASLFVKGFVPIPDFFDYHFWSHFMILRTGKIFSSLLAITFFILPFLLLKKQKLSLIFFYVVAFEMMTFFFFARLSGTRYFGIILIAFIAAIWIARKDSVSNKYELPSLPVILNFLLVIQLIGGITALSLDATRPFSESKNVALYLQRNNLEKYPILADNCLNTTVLAYLPTQAYFLSQDTWGSFCVWNSLHSSARGTLTGQELLDKASEYARQKQEKVLLMHHEKIDITGQSNIKLLETFDQSIVNTENVFLYEVSY